MLRKGVTGRDNFVTDVAKIAAPVMHVLLVMSLLGETAQLLRAKVTRHGYIHVGLGFYSCAVFFFFLSFADSNKIC